MDNRLTGTTELIEAVKQNKVRDFNELLRNGADVNARDKRKNNALHYAVYGNRTEMAKELIRCGSHLPDDILCGAVYSGNAKLVKLLIERGANVECIFRRLYGFQKFSTNETLLGYALANIGVPGYHKKIVELLVAGGADVNRPSPWFVPWVDNDKEGVKTELMPPLQIAATRGMEDVMNLLWKAGATDTLKDAMKGCRLDLAAHRGHTSVIRLAIKAGLDLNAPGYKGKRPIEFAREARHAEIVRLLKWAGAMD